MAAALVHITRREEPWTEDKDDTSSGWEHGSQSTPTASQTVLQAKRAKEQQKNTWPGSSGTPHNVQGPEAGVVVLSLTIMLGGRYGEARS